MQRLSRRLSFELLEPRMVQATASELPSADILLLSEETASAFFQTLQSTLQQGEQELSSELTYALEESEKTPIPYARIFVDGQTSMRDGSKRASFSVRLRSPSDHVFIEELTDFENGPKREERQEFSQKGGIADARWSFEIQGWWGGGAEKTTITISLWDSPKKQKLLDRVVATYSLDRNRVTMPDQTPWDSLESGLMTPTPIKPDASVVRIDGPNILLSINSPYDQSLLRFSSDQGLLTSQIIEHKGGTTLSFGSLTFDGSLGKGTYAVELLNRDGGMILDTIWVKWNQQSRSLSLVDPKDLRSTQGEHAAVIQESTRFALMNSITSILLANVDMARNQNIELLNATDALSPELDFHLTVEELNERVYKRYPEYRPENFDAGVRALQDRMGHRYRYGSVRETFNRDRLETLDRFRVALNAYGTAIGEILLNATNVIVQARQGKNILPFLDAVQMSINRWNRHDKILDLVNLGIRLPSRENAVAAAKRLFAQSWTRHCERQADVITLRQYEDRQREQGLMQTAEGEWRKVTEERVPAAAALTRAQLQKATSIGTALLHDKALRDLYGKDLLLEAAATTASLPATDAPKQRVQLAIASMEKDHKITQAALQSLNIKIVPITPGIEIGRRKAPDAWGPGTEDRPLRSMDLHLQPLEPGSKEDRELRERFMGWLLQKTPAASQDVSRSIAQHFLDGSGTDMIHGPDSPLSQLVLASKEFENLLSNVQSNILKQLRSQIEQKQAMDVSRLSIVIPQLGYSPLSLHTNFALIGGVGGTQGSRLFVEEASFVPSLEGTKILCSLQLRFTFYDDFAISKWDLDVLQDPKKLLAATITGGMKWIQSFYDLQYRPGSQAGAYTNIIHVDFGYNFSIPL